jgi:hypothetical protein
VIAGLRDALIGAGYTDEGLRRALGPSPGIGPRHDPQGSHEELMKREGIYYYLVSQQLTL